MFNKILDEIKRRREEEEAWAKAENEEIIAAAKRAFLAAVERSGFGESLNDFEERMNIRRVSNVAWDRVLVEILPFSSDKFIAFAVSYPAMDERIVGYYLCPGQCASLRRWTEVEVSSIGALIERAVGEWAERDERERCSRARTMKDRLLGSGLYDSAEEIKARVEEIEALCPELFSNVIEDVRTRAKAVFEDAIRQEIRKAGTPQEVYAAIEAGLSKAHALEVFVDAYALDAYADKKVAEIKAAEEKRERAVFELANSLLEAYKQVATNRDATVSARAALAVPITYYEVVVDVGGGEREVIASKTKPEYVGDGESVLIHEYTVQSVVSGYRTAAYIPRERVIYISGAKVDYPEKSTYVYCIVDFVHHPALFSSSEVGDAIKRMCPHKVDFSPPAVEWDIEKIEEDAVIRAASIAAEGGADYDDAEKTMRAIADAWW